MHAEVAEKFVCNDNRIILAGDAAHRFPPAGGFGKQPSFCVDSAIPRQYDEFFSPEVRSNIVTYKTSK